MVDWGNIMTIEELLSRLGDEDYIALANKGLLRRAKRDIESGITVDIINRKEDCIELEIESHTVHIPRKGPNQATCSCPSPNICHHILIACISMARQYHEKDHKVDPQIKTTLSSDIIDNLAEQARKELLAFTKDDLKKWSGLGEYKQAIKLVPENIEKIKVISGHPLSIMIPDLDIENRYIAGTGLDGMISSATKKKHKQFVVITILAFQKWSGKQLDIDPDETSKDFGSDIDMNRSKLFEAVTIALEDTINSGLTHLSNEKLQRFISLATSARGAKLPRPLLLLKSIADDIDCFLKRSASYDAEVLFDKLALLFALINALRRRVYRFPIHLIGRSRSSYSVTKEMKIVGIGAYPWQTASGYHGITVLFWHEYSSEVYSWSDVRSIEQSLNFDPVRRYFMESPWRRGGSIQKLCRHHLLLRNIKQNEEGRLGGSNQTSVEYGDTISLTNFNCENRLFTNWTRLREYTADNSTIGLFTPSPLRNVVFLKPTRFEQYEFDAIEQCLLMPMIDDQGQSILMKINYAPLTESAIEYFEQNKAKLEGDIIIGILTRKPYFSIFPVSILSNDETKTSLKNIHLDFRQKKKSSWVRNFFKNRVQNLKGISFEIPVLELVTKRSFSQSPRSELSPLVRTLLPLNEYIGALVESGTQSLNDEQLNECGFLIEEFQKIGLLHLARILDSIKSDGPSAQSLLMCRYIALLYRDAETMIV